MRPSVYERIERDRLEARRAALAAERKKRELARLRCEHASLRLDLALIRLQRVLARKYRPDQLRVPRGEDGAGRFADEGGGGGSSSGNKPASKPLRLVEVVRICTMSGKFLYVDEYGQKTHKAVYECPGGQTVTREGWGHNPRGFIPDPYQ
jgi:hypothetical protein